MKFVIILCLFVGYAAAKTDAEGIIWLSFGSLSHGI